MNILKKFSPIKTVTFCLTRKQEDGYHQSTGNISITTLKIISNKYIAKHALKLLKRNRESKIWMLISNTHKTIPWCMITFVDNDDLQKLIPNIEIIETVTKDNTIFDIYIRNKKERKWTVKDTQ